MHPTTTTHDESNLTPAAPVSGSSSLSISKMANIHIPQDLLDPKTPKEVDIRLEAREPVTDVKFYQPDGVTLRSDPVQVDFDWAIEQDTLISDPLKSLTNDLKLLDWADELLDWVNYLRPGG